MGYIAETGVLLNVLASPQPCPGQSRLAMASANLFGQHRLRRLNCSCTQNARNLKARAECLKSSVWGQTVDAIVSGAEPQGIWQKDRERKRQSKQLYAAGLVSVESSLVSDPAQASGRSADETVSEYGKEGFWSIVIPTYNRLPILTKCLEALEEQEGWEAVGVKGYEVIVVDDGSTDATVETLEARVGELRHVRLVRRRHAGATAARNSGVAVSRGAEVVFIDSDLVVTPSFLATHAQALARARARDGDDRAFTYGRVVNTSNFEEPRAEQFKITDYSAAFFATGNVAISKRRLAAAGRMLGEGAPGPFDTDFSEYGWEDLELGERLRQGGATIEQCPAAVGYHWHPAFSLDQLPRLIDQERQRGRNGVRFFRKHPNLNVRLMIQMTPFHHGLWFVLTLGGFLNERSLEPVLRALVEAGRPGLAAGLLSPILNWYTVQAVREEAKSLKTGG